MGAWRRKGDSAQGHLGQVRNRVGDPRGHKALRRLVKPVGEAIGGVLLALGAAVKAAGQDARAVGQLS